MVYAGVFGAAPAWLPVLLTRVVAFDTAIADPSKGLGDPVNLLFSIQLGGGSDIDRALAYVQRVMHRLDETVLVLVSDLYEGASREGMLARAAALVGAGVQAIAVLALTDEGAPAYDARDAGALTVSGVRCFTRMQAPTPGIGDAGAGPAACRQVGRMSL